MRHPCARTHLLKLDRGSFDSLRALRRQHFPPERNFIPAHITLFHALPGDEESAIHETLDIVSRQTLVMPVSFPGVRFMGKGVAVEADSPDLKQLHHKLAAAWSAWLSPQDQHKFQPHVTIQNKVTPEQARALHDQLIGEWRPLAGWGEGVLLWRYLGGPWELLSEYPFVHG